MAQNITARTLLRKTPGTVNDPSVPGLRFIVGKRSRTFRISPRINGTQRNLKVYTVTASDLEDAGRQLKAAREAAQYLDLARRTLKPAIGSPKVAGSDKARSVHTCGSTGNHFRSPQKRLLLRGKQTKSPPKLTSHLNVGS